MDSKLISLIKDRPIIVPKVLFNNYRKLNINDSELIIIMLLMSMGDKVIYNPDEFAKEINGNKHEVMNTINNLCDKNILSLEIEKVNRRAYEYLSLEMLYDKLYNLIIDSDSGDKKEKEEVNIKIFDVFEKELGRTLSPMEYGQIQEWLTSGNSEEIITCALKEAVLNGVGNLRYIDSILNEWKKKGYKKREDVLKDREVYRSKKSRVQVFDTDWLNE